MIKNFELRNKEIFQAFKYTDDTFYNHPKWVTSIFVHIDKFEWKNTSATVFVENEIGKEDSVEVNVGYWIVRGIKGKPEAYKEEDFIKKFKEIK